MSDCGCDSGGGDTGGCDSGGGDTGGCDSGGGDTHCGTDNSHCHTGWTSHSNDHDSSIMHDLAHNAAHTDHMATHHYNAHTTGLFSDYGNDNYTSYTGGGNSSNRNSNKGCCYVTVAITITCLLILGIVTYILIRH